MSYLQNNLNSNKLHYFFLFILSLNYFIPLIFFGGITLFHIDALDSEIPYNVVLGKILSGNLEASSIFLNGEINALYLRRIFQPYSLIYSILGFELSYWIVDVLVKITSYISMFVIGNKITKKVFISSLIACFYASSNLPTHEGFGLAIFPYIIYLAMFKDKLKLKHYFIIIFFGLNSDFIFTAFAIPALTILIFLIGKKDIWLNTLKIIIIFSFAMLIANLNLFIVAYQSVELHRSEFIRPSYGLIESIKFFFNFLLKFPTSIDHSFLKKAPYTISYIFILIFYFLNKDKDAKKIFLILFFSILFLTLLKSKLFTNFVHMDLTTIFKEISWTYTAQSYNLLYCFIALFLLKKNIKNSKILIFAFFLSIILFQINSSIVPFYKEKILKLPNYQNIYTFNGYYNFYNYIKIKKEVSDERVMSVGVDPMVATVHNINVIDGYHSIYPLEYKKKFRKIIEKELQANPEYNKYFLEWGSRVYSSLYRPQNIEKIEFNYDFAKEMGLKYIVSKYKINSNKLSIILDACTENGLCLYKIN